MKRRGVNITWYITAAAAFAILAAATSSFHTAKWRSRNWDTLELILGDNPTTFDPALIKDVAGGRLAGLLYPNLVRYDAADRIAGDLAESWEVSPDARTYTFHLRRGARASDGSPLEATDVAVSFERTLCGEVVSPRAWVLAGIRGAEAYHEGRAAHVNGVRVIDDATIEITLTRPSGVFLSLLTMPAAAVVPGSTPAKPFWGVETQPVAGGPYRISRLEPDVELVLEANPFYYGTPATSKKIRYRVIRNPFAAVAEFRQGRLDIIEVPDAFDEYFLKDARWKPYIEQVEGLNVYYLGFNCTAAPFDDKGFRRAAAMAIDRQAIIDNVLHGKATAAAGPIPPGLSGYDASLAGIPYDLEQAKKVIAAAKGGGRTLSLYVVSNSDSIIVAQALKGQLEAAGLSVEVMPREKGTFKAVLRDGDFDMVYYSWVADYADGENFLAPLFATSQHRSGGNYTKYSNPRVDALLAEAAVTADASGRAELYREAAGTVVEDAPRAFLWHARRVTVRQPWVKGYRPSHIYNAERFEGVTIEAP